MLSSVSEPRMPLASSSWFSSCWSTLTVQPFSYPTCFLSRARLTRQGQAGTSWMTDFLLPPSDLSGKGESLPAPRAQRVAEMI